MSRLTFFLFLPKLRLVLQSLESKLKIYFRNIILENIFDVFSPSLKMKKNEFSVKFLFFKTTVLSSATSGHKHNQSMWLFLAKINQNFYHKISFSDGKGFFSLAYFYETFHPIYPQINLSYYNLVDNFCRQFFLLDGKPCIEVWTLLKNRHHTCLSSFSRSSCSVSDCGRSERGNRGGIISDSSSD